MRPIVVATILITAAVASPRAQKMTIPSGQNHLILSSDKTSTLQAGLEQAASQGFHVRFGSDQTCI
jgi:hypothetical protein